MTSDIFCKAKLEQFRVQILNFDIIHIEYGRAGVKGAGWKIINLEIDWPIKSSTCDTSNSRNYVTWYNRLIR